MPDVIPAAAEALVEAGKVSVVVGAEGTVVDVARQVITSPIVVELVGVPRHLLRHAVPVAEVQEPGM